VDYNTREFKGKLIPMLRSTATLRTYKPEEYCALLVNECKKVLSEFLPFNDAEREFLDLLLNRGEIDPALLTSDPDLRERIACHPLLKWKAVNVIKYRNLS